MKTKRRTKASASSRKVGLCKIHGRPIRPSFWRAGHRNTGCTECYRTKDVPPPGKRRCKVHGEPILWARWKSGYRNRGCKLCFKVPPASKRLCQKHGRPIQPSSWRNGRHTTGCSLCHNSRPGYLLAKKRYNKRVRREATKRSRTAAKRRTAK